jgi:hypothetical protein
MFHDELEMGAPDWGTATACQAFSLAGRVENTECMSIANTVQWHIPARGQRPEMMAIFYDGGLTQPRPPSMPADVAMPDFGVLWRQPLAAVRRPTPARPTTYPADSPTGSHRSSAAARPTQTQGTRASELAMFILIQSPFTVACDSPADYKDANGRPPCGKTRPTATRTPNALSRTQRPCPHPTRCNSSWHPWEERSRSSRLQSE